MLINSRIVIFYLVDNLTSQTRMTTLIVWLFLLKNKNSTFLTYYSIINF
jgi:hypothetical protein